MSERLFQIVKSLDKNEKGYFKKLSQRHSSKGSGDNAYLRLFDIIDKSTAYDEEKIKSAFAQAGFTNLSAQKNYLYRQLLKSLRLYHSGSSITYQLHELLLDAQNMMGRKLDDAAFELLDEGIALAEASENTEMLFQFYLTYDGLLARNIGKFKPEKFESVKRKLRELWQEQDQLLTLNQLLFEIKKVDDARGKSEVLTAEIQQQADTLRAHTVFASINSMSNRAKLIAYGCMHIACTATNDDAGAFHYMKLRHELLRNLIGDARFAHNYLGNLSNLVLAALNLNDVAAATAYITELGSTTIKFPAAENYRRQLYAKNLLMYLLVKSPQGITAAEVLQAEGQHVATTPEKMGNNALMSSFYLAILFYTVNHRDKALEWFNNTVDHTNTSFANVQAYSKLIAALLHFEQGNISLLISGLQSVQYFMKKHGLTSAFLKHCIAVLQPLGHKEGRAAVNRQLEEIENAIDQFMTTGFQQEITYFHDFDLRLWARAQRTGKPYAEWLRESGNVADSQ